MAKSSKMQAAKPAVMVEKSNHTLLAGIICLLAGLAIGYYFGKESAGRKILLQDREQNADENSQAYLREESALIGILISNPRDLNSLIRLGNLYYDHGRYQNAVEYYGRALEIDPNNPNVRTDRGTSYWNLGQTDAAIGEFKKSLEVDPNHAQTLYNLGLVYLRGKNNHEEARIAWKLLLATNPDYPDRAKVEQELNSIQPADSGTLSDKKPVSNVQELLQRLKNE